jgi:hypothetical protein
LISDDLLQKSKGEIHTNWHRTTRELNHIIPKVSKTTIHLPKRMGFTLKFLMRCAEEGDEFLDSIVTEDETWGFHGTAEWKQVSAMAPHT